MLLSSFGRVCEGAQSAWFRRKGGCYVFKSTHLIYLVAQVRGNGQRVFIALSMQEGSE